MQNNFVRIAVANIDLKLLNIKENTKSIIDYINYAGNNNVDVLSFSELSLTGLSGGEMTTSEEITNRSLKALKEILKASEKFSTVISIGLPLNFEGKVYNVLALLQAGKLIQMIAKNSLSFTQKKYFSILGKDIEYKNEDFSCKIVKSSILKSLDGKLRIGFCFEDDINKELSPFSFQVNDGANIIMLAGSGHSSVSSHEDMLTLFKAKSKNNKISIAYAGASNGESGGEAVYSGEKIILENGKVLEDSKLYKSGLVFTDINLDEIKTKYQNPDLAGICAVEYFKSKKNQYILKRIIDKSPFIPRDKYSYDLKINSILNIQSEALKRRLRAVNTEKIFIGLSGGLDSTLALIVSSLTLYKMGLDSKNIYTVLMPTSNTSQRTLTNGRNLAKAYGTTCLEINIQKAIDQHYKDINHDPEDLSTAYENAQARERTQILMDLANKHGGIVLGTGNMSEIALGWATYNGDHMAMYSVNAGIPKTLLREVVRYIADNSKDNELLVDTIRDIIDTPISPELLPPSQGQISQKTENIIGPYELHDFFIYHFVYNKSSVENVLFMANQAFRDIYKPEEIEKWLNKFIYRFTSQQFKRNCMPEGPIIEDFSFSPRGSFSMASDIDINAFI